MKKTCIGVNSAVVGPLLILTAASLFAMLDICIKLLAHHFSPYDIVFYQTSGGLILLWIIAGRRNIFIGNSMRLLFLRGVVGAVAFISGVAAIRLLPVSTAMFIIFTYPAFSAIFSYIFFKEELGRAEILCLLLGLVGAGVFFDFSLTGNLLGQSLALLAGILSGLAMTLIKRLRQDNDSPIIYLYFCLGSIAVTLPKFIIDPVVPVAPVEIALVLGIVICSLGGQLLMNQGLLYCRGWEGGVFLSSEVVFTAIIGIILLDDPVNWRFWLGGSLIIGSMTLIHILRMANGKAGHKGCI